MQKLYRLRSDITPPILYSPIKVKRREGVMGKVSLTWDGFFGDGVGSVMAPAQQESSNAVPIKEWQAEQFAMPFCIESREHLEIAAGEIALKQLALEGLARQRDLEVGVVQARYAKRLDELGKAIAEKSEAVYAWCLKHEAAEFSKGKTIGFPLADVSFSVNPPAVEFLEGWDEKGVLAALKKWFLGRRYLRVKFSVDKQAIKRDWELRKGFVWARRGLGLKQGRKLSVVGTALAQVEAAKVLDAEVLTTEGTEAQRVEPS